MKKIIIILFFILNIIIFSEKTCNDTDFRQSMINYANSQVGKPYSMTGPRVGPTSFDCSGLMSASIKAGGMTSISGKLSDFGTTASGLVKSSGTLMSKNDFSNLKPGDIVHFSAYTRGTTGHVGIVVANLGNGKVEMVDARGRKYGVQRRVKDLKADSHYLGATSATQILKNNGCTNIINSSGQIVIPPAGSSIGSAGSAGGAWAGNPANLDETYEVSWDEMLENYENMIFEGLDKTLNGLLILLTLLTVIQLLKGAVPYLIGTSVNIYKDFVAVLIKYCFYAFLLKNYATVITMMYKIFTGIGSMFVNNNHISTLDELFAVSTKESLTVLKLIDQYHFDFIKILIPGSNLFDITFWKVVILILVVIMIWYFAVRIIFEMKIVFIQFFLGIGLSYIMFSLATNDVTMEMGRRPLRTMIGAGLRVTVTFLFASLVFGILEKAGFGDVTLDTVRIETMFIFIASGLLMAFLMNRISKIADSLNS